jgi:UDP-3-O-[3-hydroxymyristoyl] glucosamine N-acyltransferase
MKVSDIARALPAEVIGDAALDIRRVVHPADAEGPGDLAVALSKEALAAVADSAAGALLVPAGAPRLPQARTVLVYSGDVRLAMATVTALFDRGPAHGEGVHASAVIAADAVIGAGASIGPHAVVGGQSTVGEGTIILANVTIGAGVAIGRNCVIHPGAAIGDRVVIGDRVTIFANAVIGADGFGFIPVGGRDGLEGGEAMPTRIHSLGTVIVGDDVEIGAGTTVDRATLRQTRIGRGTKIDNQVQIGHNVVIGESCVICGLAGIAGSVVVGDRVVLAAGVGIADHVTIGSDAVIGAMSGVARSVKAGTTVFGIPAAAREVWLERHANTARLKVLYPKVDDLQRRVEALEKGAKPE